MMNLSLIVAYSNELAIGRNGDLPWRLSSDLRRFKRLTMGHHLILGRKTYESIGRELPGRQMIVITRDPNYQAKFASVANDFATAVRLAKDDDQPFVIGGGEIYRSALPDVTTLYRTRVLASIDGADAFFPSINEQQWELIESETLDAGEKDEFATVYEVLKRRP